MVDSVFRIEQRRSRALPQQFDPKSWNAYRIRCFGPRLRIWLNDILTVDFTERNSLIERRGIIGLQFHRSSAWFRDISLKDFDREPIGK